jgi:hypothetical protein
MDQTLDRPLMKVIAAEELGAQDWLRRKALQKDNPSIEIILWKQNSQRE